MNKLLINNKNNALCSVIIAFLAWGTLPVYWKTLETIPATVILANRIIWSLIFTIILLALNKSFIRTLRSITGKKDILSLCLRSFFLAGNWLTYVWGINNNHIIECSMGYFICPITTVLLAGIFLKERITKWQLISILIITAAVLNLILTYGVIPWVSLSIAFTFSFYALFRKTSTLESLPGLATELMVLLIPAIIFLVYYSKLKHQVYFLNESSTLNILLIISGIVTALPLLSYAYGVRKIKLSTAGVLQYTTPAAIFILGVFLYKEHFNLSQCITFAVIWIGVIIFTTNNMYVQKTNLRAVDNNLQENTH